MNSSFMTFARVGSIKPHALSFFFSLYAVGCKLRELRGWEGGLRRIEKVWKRGEAKDKKTIGV